MHPFNLGEKVGFLSEKGTGIVKQINGFKYLIQDEIGFERWLHLSEIIKLHDSLQHIELEDVAINRKKQSDESLKASRKVKSNQEHEWEIDLHSYAIMDSEINKTAGEIFRYQVSILKSFLRRAEKHKIRKVIIVHGIGEGVLKNEVRYIISKIDNMECMDADFKKYGKGATEVRIYYKF